LKAECRRPKNQYSFQDLKIKKAAKSSNRVLQVCCEQVVKSHNLFFTERLDGFEASLHFRLVQTIHIQKMSVNLGQIYALKYYSNPRGYTPLFFVVHGGGMLTGEPEVASDESGLQALVIRLT
jgi:hypothetical protein